MIELTQHQIAEVCEGDLLFGAAKLEGFPTKASVDTRTLEQGDLFFGLPGENLDGSTLAREAVDRGAWGVVVTAEAAQQLRDDGEEVCVIACDDPTKALGLLASAWRSTLNGGNCRVVGITGSVGKTSTKDILGELVAREKKVVASPQNFNTEIGLPLTVLQADADTEVLVLEMAMRGRGQIAQLGKIASPDVGIITNIGPVHLALLGTEQAVLEAKAELLEGLDEGNACVIPTAAAGLRAFAGEGVRVIEFAEDVVEGGNSDADVVITSAGRHDGLTDATFLLDGEQLKMTLNFAHRHNLRNATAALGAYWALGLPLERLAGGTIEVEFSRLRGEQMSLPGGITVINDCYNANPVSMEAALEHLRDVAQESGEGRVVAVLGDMAELGSGAEQFHANVGCLAAKSGVGLLVGVGDLARHYGESEGFEFIHVRTTEEAADLVPNLLQSKDTVLLKASRSVGLELVAEALA